MSESTDNLRAMMDGRCLRCGGYSGDRELWDPHCPRCAELERLEREIGRAVIANYIVNNAIYCLDQDWRFTRPTNDAMNVLNKCLIVEGSIVGLIARWRQLHAEGAE